MTTPATKYNDPTFFKQDGSQSGKGGPLQQAGSNVANNNKIVYPPNMGGGVKTMETPMGEMSINKT